MYSIWLVVWQNADVVFVFYCRGLVPLHNACSYGHYDVTELLLKVCCVCVLSVDVHEFLYMYLCMCIHVCVLLLTLLANMLIGVSSYVVLYVCQQYCTL